MRGSGAVRSLILVLGGGEDLQLQSSLSGQLVLFFRKVANKNGRHCHCLLWLFRSGKKAAGRQFISICLKQQRKSSRKVMRLSCYAANVHKYYQERRK
ncbi:MAG: hypothetical protein A2X81_15800 [Desulfobacterales bacterium GWB2_56_26]|nr:MAG: hypothetical protein A2X81_15800 [Desulfobacterales bacterium GWB2_56_26]